MTQPLPRRAFVATAGLAALGSAHAAPANPEPSPRPFAPAPLVASIQVLAQPEPTRPAGSPRSHQQNPGPGHQAWEIMLDVHKRLRTLVVRAETRLPGGGDFLLVLPDQLRLRTAAQIASARDLLADAERDGLFRDLDRAAALARQAEPAEFADDPHRDWLDPHPDAAALRELGRLCRAKAFLALERGEWDLFRSHMQQMFGVAHLLLVQNDYTATSSGLGIDHMALVTLEDALAFGPPASVLRDLAQDLDLVVKTPRSDWAVRVFVRSNARVAVELISRAAEPGEVLAPIDPELVAFVEVRLLIIAAADRPSRPGLSAETELVARCEVLRTLPLLALSYFGSSISGVRESFLRLLDLHRMRFEGARTLLALETYERDHGRYPDSLDALIPAYLPGAPHDPITGGTFVYEAAPDQRAFRLYAFGFDGKDNGGIALPSDRRSLSSDTEGFDDIIWPKP